MAWHMPLAQADKNKIGSSTPLPHQGTPPPGKVMAGLRREPTRGTPLDAVRGQQRLTKDFGAYGEPIVSGPSLV